MIANSSTPFLAEVKELRSPRLLQAHEQLLALIKSSAPRLWADFNATGSDDKDYQIKITGVGEHILRVGAAGKLKAFWKPLRIRHPRGFMIFRNKMDAWVKNSSNPMASDFQQAITELDLEALVSDLKTVADAVK